MDKILGGGGGCLFLLPVSEGCALGQRRQRNALRWEGQKHSNKSLQESVNDPGNSVAVKFNPGQKRPWRKQTRKIGRKTGRGGGHCAWREEGAGVGGWKVRGRKCWLWLRRRGWGPQSGEKWKSRGGKERGGSSAPGIQTGPPSRGEGGAGHRGAAWPALSALGSRRRWLLRAPSLAGALFLCRETRKLPFDCGSPRTGRGARQSGSEWQRGKGGALPAPAASRVRSPPGAAATAAAAAAAAALARRQPRGKRPAPAGRPERAQHVAPRAAVGATGHRSPSAEPGREALAAERDAEPGSRAGPVHRAEPAAGEWTGRSRADARQARPAGPNSHAPHFRVSSLMSWGGRGLDFFISLGRKILLWASSQTVRGKKVTFFLLLLWGRSSWEAFATHLPPGCAPGCAEAGGRVEWRRGELAVELSLGRAQAAGFSCCLWFLCRPDWGSRRGVTSPWPSPGSPAGPRLSSGELWGRPVTSASSTAMTHRSSRGATPWG